MAAFNERLARQFQKEGHEVFLETFTLQYPNFLFPGKTQFSESPAPSDLQISRSVNSVNPFNWISVGKKIRDLKPDILVLGFWIPFMAPCMGTIARIVRKNGHTKVSAVLHNVVPHEPRIGDKSLVSYFIKSVDGCVVMSKSVEDDVLQFEKKKAVGVCPHPLYDHFGTLMPRETALESLSLDCSYRYLLFFGLIRDYKGLDLLLEAFADKRIDKSKFRLLIAGEYYGDGEKYENMAKELGVYDTVKADGGSWANVSSKQCGNIVKKAIEKGYYIRLYYVGLNTVEESLVRIENRVKKGGHNIPDADVKRRFNKRFEDLTTILQYCDEATFYDNENGFVAVAEYKNGEILQIGNLKPEWLNELLEYMV